MTATFYNGFNVLHDYYANFGGDWTTQYARWL